MQLDEAELFIKLFKDGLSGAELSTKFNISISNANRKLMFLKINGPEEFKDYFVYKQCPKYTKLEIANIVEFLLEHDLNNEKGFVLFKVSPSKLYKDIKQRESTGEPLLPNASSSSIVVPINKLEQLNYLSLTEFTAKPIILPHLRPFAAPASKNQDKLSVQASTKAVTSFSTIQTTATPTPQKTATDFTTNTESSALTSAYDLTLAPAQDISKFSNQSASNIRARKLSHAHDLVPGQTHDLGQSLSPVSIQTTTATTTAKAKAKAISTATNSPIEDHKLATVSDLLLATPQDANDCSNQVAANAKSLSLASACDLTTNLAQAKADQTTPTHEGNQESTQILPASLLASKTFELSNDSQLLSSLPEVTLQQALEMHWHSFTPIHPAQEYFANPEQTSKNAVFDPESKGFNKLPVKIQLNSLKLAYADKLKEIALLKKALTKAYK